MKRVIKPLLLIGVALLLICATVFTTLAFLTDETGTVLNTFTAGNVEITLDEAEVNETTVDETGTPVDPENCRTDTGNKYKLIPGSSYYKDPTIHVSDDSENCLLFIEINDTAMNAGDEVEKALSYTLLPVSDTVTVDGSSATWEEYKTDGTKTIYYLEKPVLPGSDVLIFDGFSFSSAVSDMEPYVDSYLAITAYALQAEGFFLDEKGEINDVDSAWAALTQEIQ